MAQGAVLQDCRIEALYQHSLVETWDDSGKPGYSVETGVSSKAIGKVRDNSVHLATLGVGDISQIIRRVRENRDARGV
jgi:hypothetical protein